MTKLHRLHFLALAIQLLGSVYIALDWLLVPFHWGYRLAWDTISDVPFLAAGWALLIVVAALRLRADSLAPRSRWRHGALMAVAFIGLVSCFASSLEVVTSAAVPVTWLLVLTDLFLAERGQRRFPRATLGMLLMLVLVQYACTGPTGYDYYAPGSFEQMDRIARVQGGKPAEHILGLTVSSGNAPPVILLAARFTPAIDLLPKNQQAGFAEARELAVARSGAPADRTAAAVAEKYLGLGKGAVPSGRGMLVTWVALDGPSAGRVQPYDLVAAADGKPVQDLAGLVAVMQQTPVGKAIKLELIRNGKRMESTVTIAPRPDAPRTGYLGLQGEADLSYDIPVPVTVDRSRVDGSSWGGMLALEIISQLTPGGITHGHVVAGTGTIQADGSIGQIGGIAQKVWMAEHAGADVVFVPASQLADAGRLAEHIQIVPVRNLDEIIAWLQAHPQK